ncbi:MULTISPECIES: hypothetical protein [unclassified Duganella]|uniref:hypothetical protein n=1 Tax=unclassified Duganella TaxID=2636909 RepID=UPI00088CD5B1|nr:MULTISPECIES: hypothetical protein [unclassified Duganella]SDG54142.1 hypothetical protein SAMN05216320_105142 [Duganella sp. OV458]SDJ76802.1 hypothetical protein SAMN05428973_106143 [Duganella sp. OV510]
MENIDIRFLGIDEGLQLLHLIDTRTGEFAWTLDLAAYPLARDMQRLDDRRVLVGYDHGYFELDSRSGRVLMDCRRWKDVTAVTRLPDGATLVTGMNLDGRGGVNVLTLDAQGELVHVATREGDYVRLMRVTPQGTYLLCTNDHIKETTPDLVELCNFTAPGFEHAWKAERQADGSTIVSAGYGAFIAVFDANGQLVQRIGGADAVPAGVAPFFYATYAFLPDGQLLVANWQGHGPDNGHKGPQLLQFDTAGQLVATWSAPDRISSLQGLLLM